MAEDFRLDPTGLSAANNDFKGVGDRLGEAYDALTAVLDDHHGCWGTDDIGKAFEKNYVPSADELTGAGEEVVNGMVELHDGVDETRETFEGVDHENAVKIDNSVNDQ